MILKPATTVAALASVILLTGTSADATGRTKHTNCVPKNYPTDMQSVMDVAIDPCDDFYQYACGGWLQRAIIPEEKGYIDYSFSTIRNRNDNTKQFILVSDKFPILSNFYASCVNQTHRDEIELEPVLKKLQAIQNANTKENLLEIAAKHSLEGVPSLVQYKTIGAPQNAELNVLYVSPSGLTLIKEQYSSVKFGKYATPFREYVEKLFTLSGTAEPNTAATSVVELEKKIASISTSEASIDELSSFEDLISGYKRLLGILFRSIGVPSKFLPGSQDEQARRSQVVYPVSIKFLQGAENLLEDTELPTLKSYFTYRVLHYYAESLTSQFGDAYFQFFHKHIKGRQLPLPMSKVCTDAAEKVVGDLLGEQFLQQEFPAKSAESVKRMVKDIKSAIESNLQSNDWMSVNVKQKAVDKLSKMVDSVGGTATPERYETLTFNKGDYIGNRVQAIKFDNAAMLSAIGSAVDRSKWNLRASSVNANYLGFRNQINLPAGILQSPMFNITSDASQNYGAIGMVLGHEITHGFDFSGRNNDDIGNVRQWWDMDTLSKFSKSIRCISDQYSSMPVHSDMDKGKVLGRINFSSTFNEITADYGGLAAAFQAYKKHTEAASPPSATTSDAKSLGEEMFFISFAQSWCSKSTDADLKYQLETSNHPPHKYRVLGTLRNNKDFARVFQCPVGSKMNPEEKCTLW